jgi:hypothetical protein
MKIDSKLKTVAVGAVALFAITLGSGVAMGMNGQLYGDMRDENGNYKEPDKDVVITAYLESSEEAKNKHHDELTTSGNLRNDSYSHRESAILLEQQMNNCFARIHAARTREEIDRALATFESNRKIAMDHRRLAVEKLKEANNVLESAFGLTDQINRYSKEIAAARFHLQGNINNPNIEKAVCDMAKSQVKIVADDKTRKRNQGGELARATKEKDTSEALWESTWEAMQSLARDRKDAMAGSSHGNP